MALELELRQQPDVPLEVEGIVPDRLAGVGPDAIRRLPVSHGNRTATLGDWFRVTGDLASDETIVFRGDLRNVHWIGAHMKGGMLRVEGPAGRHAGSEMEGGTMEVWGDVGDWAGAQMRRGTLRVHGRAGHLVGAAYRGSVLGMRGGVILVDGDAGNEIGHSMRRGLIAVGGTTGDLVGFHMRAGTIVSGRCGGIRHGAGMVRGTLVFLTGEVPLLPTFRRAGKFTAVSLGLLAASLGRVGWKPSRWGKSPWMLAHGDLLAGGRGEIWSCDGAET